MSGGPTGVSGCGKMSCKIVTVQNVTWKLQPMKYYGTTCGINEIHTEFETN
jgi:hypothetical protein